MGNKVAIVGVGQTNHTSKRRDVNGQELINEAVRRALEAADLKITDIDAFVIGNMDHFEGINYIDCWSVDGSGAYGKPIMKVTTGGSTGGTLSSCAYYHVASGLFDVVMAIGWEKNSESDTQAAISTCADPILERDFFGGAIGPNAAAYAMYMEQYGATQEDAARVAVRDHNNALNNPFAHLRKRITTDDVMKSTELCWPIKLLDSCPRSDGACAVIYTSEKRAPKIVSRPAWVYATAVSHDCVYFGDFDWETMPTLKAAIGRVYQRADITNPRNDIDVMELYLPFSTCGVIWMDHMGLCGLGEAPRLIQEGVFDVDGALPVNPSGGVMSTNPIGATALIRVGEAALQVMGKADAKQIPGVETALATAFGSCWWFEATVLGATKPR